jgi:hypothetical protein
LSTSSITSSLLSQIAGSDASANQFVSDLNQLAQDLQTGNLSAAQQDYVTLSQHALNGVTSSTSTTSASGITTGLLSDIASSPSNLSTFVDDLNQLGTDLQNGNLSSAQEDMLGLDSTALQATSTTSTSTGATGSTAGAITATNQAQANALIQAIVKAMSEGDDSAVSSGLSELASISQSSAGASILQSESQNYGANASSSSSSSPVQQLLQQLSP